MLKSIWFETIVKLNPSKRINKISRDSLPHLLNCLLKIGWVSEHTWIGRMLAWWWRIELGKNSRFYGLPLFRRLPGSRIRIGDNCEFRSSQWSNLVGLSRPCMVSTATRTGVVEIGNDCGFSGAIISCATRISIGDRVKCEGNVTIIDSDRHATDWRDRLAGRSGATAPIEIGDDVWLGMNTIVLKGVSIGCRTIVQAGSTVTRSLPNEVIAAGQPAVVVRKLTDDEQLESASGCSFRNNK